MERRTVPPFQYMVPIAGNDFAGIVRSNKTAAFIVDCLKTETAEDQILDVMCARYAAPREVIAADLKTILQKFRSIHALDE